MAQFCVGRFPMIAVLVLTALPATHFAAAQCGQWLPTTLNAGLLGNSEVHCMTTWDPDGFGPERTWLILGGELSQMVAAERLWSVVGWDGAAWRSIGSLPRQANALAVWNGELYAGIEHFDRPDQPVSTVMHWTGTDWETLGTLNSDTITLAVFNEQLYAGGDFTLADGQPVGYIARWNPDAPGWQALPGGGADGRVLTLTPHNDGLYVGGDFDHAGGLPAANIARFDGIGWQTLGEGLNNLVHESTVYQGHLVVVGHFGEAGGEPALRIARWTGSQWLPFDTGMNHRVWCVTTNGDRLYAGGQFTSAGGVPVNFVAEWNGSVWAPLDVGTSGVVASLQMYDDELIVGGYFNMAGDEPTQAVASWQPGRRAWDPLEAGFQRRAAEADVRALVAHDGRIYAGGAFDGVDGKNARSIAIWDGLEWREALRGVTQDGGTGIVESLTAYSPPGLPPRTDVLIGGAFDRAGGDPGEFFSISANNIAFYRNILAAYYWVPLGSGAAGTVYATTAQNGQFIAATTYPLAGNTVARVQRWNSVTDQWDYLGPAFDGPVYALHVHNGELFAAGQFEFVGIQAARNVARWSGSFWQPMGAGISFWSEALTSFDGALIAGGAQGVYRWTGSVWQEIGPVDGLINIGALTVYNGSLIAGGWFVLNGAPAGVARWDGAHWLPLGAGLTQPFSESGAASDLAVLNGELIVGGHFTRAGGQVAMGWARWTDTNIPWVALQPAPQTKPCFGSADFNVSAAMGYDGLSYQWRRNGIPLLNGPSPGGSIISGADSPHLHIAGLRATDAGSYSVVISTDCGAVTSHAVPLTVTGVCTGDVDGDGAVSLADLARLLSNFGCASSCSPQQGDLNADGVIGLDDLTILLANFGTVFP